MLAILSRRNDAHADAAAWALRCADLPVHPIVLADSIEDPSRYYFDGALHCGAPLENIHTAWVRRLPLPTWFGPSNDQPAAVDTLDLANAERTYDQFIGAIQSVICETCETINSPEAISRYSNKLSAYQLANRHGLTYPRTLISADIRHVKATFQGPVVFKPLRHNVWQVAPGRYSVARTRLIEPSTLSDGRPPQVMPAIWQAPITKRSEIRIVTFGPDRVFAFRQTVAERSEKFDWREALADSTFEPVSVNRNLSAKIAGYITDAGIETATFDFAEDEYGRLWFLDFNPCGQFLYIEEHTPELKLLAKLGEYLARRVFNKAGPGDITMGDFRQSSQARSRPVHNPSADFISLLTTKALQYGETTDSLPIRSGISKISQPVQPGEAEE